MSVVVVDGETGETSGTASAVANASGYWLAHLAVTETSRPQNITVNASSATIVAGQGLAPSPSVTITDVLFGSVFLCSGQVSFFYCRSLSNTITAAFTCTHFAQRGSLCR